ncbi:MAG: gliding motility-associated C-terminal domain-containing protein [Pedobacter sp.]|nr:MAG: gliding motility-associated C-terminal domain-containing protein [Pedobacter sp.]
MRFPHFVVILLLFSLSISYAKGETFVVTSNADAGNNTLRDALTKAAANGNAETDQILFNLPTAQLSDRTITLLSVLPEITSNLVIDGSSQPGPNLGVSGAKVVIEADRNTKFSFFTINKLDIVVGIYGLKLYKAPLALPFQFELAYGISINTKSKVTVGAPGKGNVICGFWAGIFGNIGDSKIQSNFIGVLEDGNTAASTLKGIIGRPSYDYLENALIGGEQRNEGNLIAGCETGISFDTPSISGTSETITIINNSIGTNFTETAIIPPPSVGFQHIYSRQSVVLIVKKNVFAPNMVGLQLHNGTKATLLGNFFGTNRSQSPVFNKMNSTAISGNSFVELIVGGEQTGDDNIFTNYQNPISVLNASKALVTKNNFYCNTSAVLTIGSNFIDDFKILGHYGNRAFGNAQANALIQLYDIENSCGPCNPKERFASVFADANGKWEYNGLIKGAIMGTATLNGNSVGFEPISLQDYEIKITQVDCNQNGGVEVIEKREGSYTYQIKDNNGNVVSTNQNEKNLQPGSYTLELTMLGGCTNRKRIDIFNLKPVTFPTTVNLACNTAEGNFNGNASVPRGGAIFFWEDENGVSMPSTQPMKLRAGKYYFYVKDAAGCISNKSLFTVLASPLPATIDDSNLVYEDADCGTATGSIKGMNVTIHSGTATYAWQTQIGQNFSSGLELVNAPAGQYRLAIFTNSSCGVIYSPYYTIKEQNSIVINEVNARAVNAKCGINKGHITGMVVTGTNLIYDWKDESGNSVGNTLELNDVPIGKYYLLVKNSNCSKRSSTFTVDLDPIQQFPAYSVSVTKTSCGLDNGSLAIDYGSFNPPKAVRWVKNNITVGTAANLTNQPAGKYSLMLTNDAGCERFFESYTIEVIKPLTVDVSKVSSNPDHCGTGNGNITGVIATAESAVSFAWKDKNNQTVATTKDLANAKAGNYTLTVNDGLNTSCSTQTFTFTVVLGTSVLITPIMADVKICAAGNAKLVVSNSINGNYKLYQNLNDPFPVQTNTTGNFMVDVKTNSTYYISYNLGNCESDKAAVNITVADANLEIPSSFSPNGDGVNDVWQIKNLNNYPTANVKVFNRNGSLVYEQTGAAQPFNGLKNNRVIPVGVYYYFILLRKGCATLSGTITLIR